MFLRQLLIEAQEVAEAPSHRERLGAEHGERRLERKQEERGHQQGGQAERARYKVHTLGKGKVKTGIRNCLREGQ